MSRAAVPILAVMGGTSLLNGLWMLAAPLHWYRTLPAGVPHYGPFNAHFVRDIGCAFLVVGGALLAAARRPELRAALTAVGAAFAGLHAAVHVWDTARGHVPAQHWLMDLPGVYAPAALLLWLWWALSGGASGRRR